MPGMALPRTDPDPDRPNRDGRLSADEADPFVDRRGSASLSFGTHRAAQPPFGGQIPGPVGPGRTPPVSPPNRAGEGVSEFPLQAAKVQRPALRVETLQRDRLLDWLSSQAEARVILITAEAGYGKTTLLADFSRHTRRRVLWYRIDENDRSWVSLVRYLVAAGAEVDPAFGSATSMLLDRLGTPDGPSRDEIVAALIGDYQAFGSGTGAILILDDYHQVDDVPEIRVVLNEFVSSRPGSPDDRDRRPADARPGPGAAALDRRRRGAPDRRSSLRPGRVGPTLPRDVRANARPGPAGRPRPADRRLGSLPAARAGRPPEPAAAGGPRVHPGPERCHRRPARLPRRGGRRRPPARDPAVPDAHLPCSSRSIRSSPQSSARPTTSRRAAWSPTRNAMAC